MKVKEYLDLVAAWLGCAIIFLTGAFILFAVMKALLIMWSAVF